MDAEENSADCETVGDAEVKSAAVRLLLVQRRTVLTVRLLWMEWRKVLTVSILCLQRRKVL